MAQQDLTELSDEALLQKRKRVKSNKKVNAFMIGIFVGIAVFSAARNGLGFATIFPLVFVYFAFLNGRKEKVLDKEFESRDLK